MGNKVSSDDYDEDTKNHDSTNNKHEKYRSFPGSAMLEKTLCGSIDTTDPDEYRNASTVNQLLKRAEVLCVSSPVSSGDSNHKRYHDDDDDDTMEENSIRDDSGAATTGKQAKKSSQNQISNRKNTGKLLARALVSEVINNPKTMKQADLQDRERRLLKAASAATKLVSTTHHLSSKSSGSKPVGAAAPPHVLRSVAFACTGDENAVGDLCPAMMDPTPLGGALTDDNDITGFNEGDMDGEDEPGNLSSLSPSNKKKKKKSHMVTIGVALSRQSEVGHPATITRQTTYDWNKLQDRSHKYVSAIGAPGWRGGGGTAEHHQPDQLHLPIIHIHCPNQVAVDEVIAVLASGEIFIPQMSVLPEQLTTVHHAATGMTDLVVNFGCERNDTTDDAAPVEEWPNWCLEFMHNQLYEYFSGSALWMKRSFSVTLATQVRWKTVKHMTRFFENSEKVVAAWREKGPQSLTPTSSQLDGGASGEEVSRPHGIYLYQSGVPTNYFAPNFAPPYTTKMTRSLLLTVLLKSWDKKRREWSSKPIARLAPPSALMAVACGYDPVGTTGYLAKEVTTALAATPAQETSVRGQQEMRRKEPLSEVEFGRSVSDDISQKENSSAEKKPFVSIVEKEIVAHPQVEQNRDFSGSKTGMLTKKNNNRRLTDDAENNISVVHSTFNMSVAESGITVQQSNLSSKKSFCSPNTRKIPVVKGIDHKQLYCDEEFMEELSMDSDPPGNAVNSKSPASTLSPREAAILREAQVQNERSSFKMLESPINKNSSPTKKAQFKMDREKVAHSAIYTPMAVSSPRGRGVVEQAASLEYSTDGSSAFFTQDTGLYGQHLASQDEQNHRFAAPRISLLQPMVEEKADDDDESALLSLQASSSSMQSAVPTDEELFSVGWAKALDHNSGNYYYFTLDRTKTIWDNPLASSQWGEELPPPVKQHSPQPQRSVQSIDP